MKVMINVQFHIDVVPTLDISGHIFDAFTASSKPLLKLSSCWKASERWHNRSEKISFESAGVYFKARFK